MVRFRARLGGVPYGVHLMAAFGVGFLAGFSILWATQMPVNNAATVNSNGTVESDPASTERLTRFEEAYPASYLAGFPAVRASLDDGTSNPAPAEAASVLERVKPAVVRVLSSTVAGSGVVIDSSGTVLTSAHIPVDDEFVHVIFDGKEPLIGTVMAKTPPGLT